MNKALIFVLLMAGTIISHAQSCFSCGKLNGGGSSGRDVGPNFSVSLGTAQYGESAGRLVFSSSLPDPKLFTPAALQFTATNRPDVTVITTNLPVMATTTTVSTDVIVITNISYLTNLIYDSTGTNLIPMIETNAFVDQETVVTTNTTTSAVATNAVIRQVNTPQALADIPIPPTSNGYVINFYYPSQVGSVNSDGTYAVSGTPFITWVVTNPAPATINQLQISQIGNVPSYGLMKQWTYAYNTNAGSWSVTDLGGVQETMIVTNLNASAYQVINTIQYSNGPVAQQTSTTYTNFSVGGVPMAVPFEVDVGSSSAPKRTTYSYNSSGLKQAVTHPDGSWEYYNTYDANGNPTVVYSSFGDASVGSTSARETDYAYGAGYGDDGTINPRLPRQVINKIQGHEISCTYTLYLSVGVRLDIQCTAPYPNDQYNSTGNLVTTNSFYTSGPNQFALQSVVRPDKTMTTYNYITNGTYRTNITVTGQPDSAFSHIVDGVSNVTVLNNAGYNVSAVSYDVLSGILLSQDIYGNFDTNGRPQQVTHLDTTTNITQYACCGLDVTIDPDGIWTQYLYDASKRQVGYEKIYNGSPITYTNVLDAAGRILQSLRIGSDNSSIITGQSAYDVAGELAVQTNALNGVVVHTWVNTSTGGFIRTTTNPDSGTVTNYYYADGSLKETIGTAVHGIRYTNTVESDGGTYRLVNWQIKLDTSGNDTAEYTKTFTDFAGRNYKTVYASASGTPTSGSFYNPYGQLVGQVDPDGVTNLYQYNAKGEQAFTIVDMNQNGSVDLSGTDRITWTTNDVTTDHSTNVRRTRTYVWDILNSNSYDLISTVETSTDGLNIWQTQSRDAGISVTNYSQTVPGTSRVVTTIATDGSYTISAFSYGWLVSSTRYDSTGTQIGATSYAYDSHGRQYQVTDARNGTTVYGFNNADQATSVTTPNPGTLGGSAQTTTTAYNNLMQPTSVVQPDGTTVNNFYLLTGELGETYGSRTYPVAYSYDYAGRMKTMTNWSNFGGGTGARVTTWKYDSYRGFLTNKVYDGGTAGPLYTYTPAGRLASRVWARGTTTSYAYDAGGGLTNVTYSDSTPAVATAYDRLGRPSSIICNGMTDTLTYNLANELLGELFSGGTLANLSITNVYDADLRRSTLSALASGSPLSTTTYGYDHASRLATVSDGTNNAAYSYVANSPLVSQITFKSNSVTRMTTTKQYDYLSRLTSISSVASNTVSFNYNYNAVNQRTRDTLADGSYWIYTYDSLGQVTGGNKYWSDGTPVAGQQFDYTFDTIGNRTQTLSGGDQNGGYLRAANYYANNLNQITNRDVPGYVDVKGVSIATNTVTVNGNTAYRKVEYFRNELAVTNSSTALWTNIVVAATGQTSQTGNVFVAKAPEVFGYDADGNMTNDGRWTYIWDAENRLVDLISLSSAPAGSQLKLDFGYDGKGRRIQKIVSTNNGTSYVAQSTNRFLYDGWNLVAETGPNNSLIRSYMWGMDLSGSMQGAGGVSGLLEVSYYGSPTTNCFPAYDGNGNITALINVADGTTLANYEFGPFGEPIRLTGMMAKNNPFLFSTKYYDLESGLYYYGYRFYNPSTGAWPNRDPLGELGFQNLRNSRLLFMLRQTINKLSGNNLYCLLNNQPISVLDVLGLGALTPCGSGLKLVPWIDFSYRKSTYDISIVDLLPWEEILKKLNVIKEALDDVETANGLLGEEYGSRAETGCVPQCFVQTCQTDKVENIGVDVDDPDGVSIEIIIRWILETDYSYGPPGFIHPACVNRNSPPVIPFN